MNSGKPNITDIAWALISKWAHTEATSKAKRCDLEVCELIGLGDLEGAYALRDSAAVNDYSIKKVIKKRSFRLAMSLAFVYQSNGAEFVKSHLGAWL
jgi:hypothetical protein